MSNPKTKSLNEQLAALDELMAWFEQDDFDLDQALAKFDEATALVKDIKKRLATLENKITVLTTRFDRSDDA